MKPWWLLAVGIILGVGVGFLAFRKPAVAPISNTNSAVNVNANTNTNASSNANVNTNTNGNANSSAKVSTFDECAAKGYPISETYPRTCAVPGGKTYTEDIGNALDETDLIVVTAPKPNTVVSSPLNITGEARGSWFFEAEFRIQLLDSAGKEVAAGTATAKGDWMTSAFVPFNAALTFSKPKTTKGTLVLHKDNPSGIPANDDQLTIPVKF